MSETAISFREESSVNLACFEVKGQIHALDVLSVREIVRMQPIAPLPNSPSLIEGVIDLRSAVIPVLDLSRVLGLGPSHVSPHARIVVLEFQGLVLGLWVDAATDVLTLDSDRLEDVPALASQTGYDAVRYVIRRSGESPVMVLSLESLIQKVYGSERVRESAEGERR